MEGQILLFIQENIRCSFLTPIMKIASFICDHGEVWILCALILLSIKKTRKCGIALAIALLMSFIINNLILKNVIQRPRPYEVVTGLIPLIDKLSDYSFPSGHTGASFAAAYVIIKSRLPRFGIAAIILAVIIAFSRLYLGVHYPSDVAAGMIIGVSIAFITVKVMSKYYIEPSA